MTDDKDIILRGADKATKGGFTQVPNFVLKSPDLSSGAKLVFTMLLTYAWQNNYCFPGQDRLGEDLGHTRQWASKYLKELQEHGLVDIKKRGQGRPNVYTLNFS